ncbi:FMN-dependent NADH-azoreductase [Paraburkholderia humisilvae]|uniref:FMN dependent NADH:quinone oxidoreductase n=1 Tax=Paraburkholderia humisilvae TaxID=627669 RepID=A0A6J5FC92_9BURK|nr:NAD(P)H-dependent oxidoreductase [Paraburkholderia humisilvae]CAB3774845.1 FMN-dependent NADH-azoreductase 1 [Paraburkholderia humisilvae]
MKLMQINASARGVDSESLFISSAFVSELISYTEVDLDTYNLFEDSLPEFGAVASSAKMSILRGGDLSIDQKTVWGEIKRVFERFAAADAYVFNVPLWNNGVPYKLKQFIDVVTQPGLAFEFDVENGYIGLMRGRKSLVIHASGVYYEGVATSFGSDFSTPYVEHWLQFIGVESIQHVHVAPTVLNTNFFKTKGEAEVLVRNLARNWLGK